MSLNKIPKSFKVLLTIFIIWLNLAYIFSLILVKRKSGFSFKKIVLYYRGGETNNEIYIPKSLTQIMQVIHPHLFTIPLIFFLLCSIFQFSSYSEKIKISLYVSSFLLILIDLFSPIGLRFYSLKFYYLFVLSGGLLFILFLTLSFLCLNELWNK